MRQRSVALPVGVWIETLTMPSTSTTDGVALPVGAWIETRLARQLVT